MARSLYRLSAALVAKAKTPRMYADGGGLYLQVSKSGARSWIFRFTRSKKSRDMGLGSLKAVSLAKARELAAECRKNLSDGLDPIEVRKEQRKRLAAETARTMRFREAAEAYIQAHRPSWRNAKHRAQWPATLETYAYPFIGDVSVGAIDTGMVMRILQPIWTTKTETASRVRGRIETVLDWASANGLRQGDNPARWRGHIANLLPSQKRLRDVRHHPALRYDDLGAFMEKLRAQSSISSYALEFLILTATRTSEVLGAVWAEIDLEAKTWTVPATRIKARREHRVPLSPAALAVLNSALRVKRTDEFVFPGQVEGRGLSNMALLVLLRRMGYGGLTVHGFRSTFRDWAAEATNYPSEVAEMALAHAIANDVEKAYRRGDLFNKRRQMMNAWTRYCGTMPTSGRVGKVIRIGA